MTTWEIRNSKTSSHGMDAMRQFLRALPAPRGPQLWQRPGHAILLTFATENSSVRTFVSAPSGLSQSIQHQLGAAYPQARIDEHTLPSFERTAVHFAAKLGGKFGAPLTVDTTTDPITSLLSALATAHEDERIVFQMWIRRAPDSWRTYVQKRNTLHGVEPSALLTAKLQEQGYQVHIDISMSATEERMPNILSSIQNALQSYRSNEATWKLQKTIGLWAPFKNWETLSLSESAALFHLPYTGVAHVKNIAWGGTLTGEAPECLPLAAQQTEVVPLGTTLFQHQQQVFGIKPEDRRRHTYVMGKSGAGKSTLLANMIIHDLKHGKGVAVIDPHGDLIDTLLDFIPKDRQQDVIVFDPSDADSVPKLSLFSGSDVAQRELIVSGMMSVFHKLYGHSWGPRLEYFLRNGLFTLLDQDANLSDVLRLYTDQAFRENILRKISDPALLRFWHDEFDVLNDRLKQESISPILNKVGQFVTSPLIRHVVDVRQSSFSLDDVLNNKKILLVNVSQGKLGEDNATLLGAMIITKLQLAAMARAHMPEQERTDFYLYIDEFQNFATESFMKILSEARKYHLNLTLANQYIAQLPPEVRTAIFGNAGTLISFLVGAEDAAWMAREFGNVYKPEELTALGKYEMILKMLVDGQTYPAFPATSLPLAKSRNQHRQAVLRFSQERYGK